MAFVIGAAAVVYHCGWLWLFGSIAAIYGGYDEWKYSRNKKKPVIFLLCMILCMAGGSFCSYEKADNRSFYTSYLQDDEECLLQGQIYQKEEKKEQHVFYLKNCILQYHQKQYHCNQVLVYLDTDMYSIGKILCVKGKIHKFSLPTNDGAYNERQYYHSMNLEFAIEDATVTDIYGNENIVKEYLYGVKERIKESYANCLNAKDAGVMTAMTLGDKNFLDAEMKSMYQKAGISHFYSISGMHISMLGMAFYRILRKGRFSYGASGVLAGGWIVLYGALSGFGISSARAIGMFLLLLYAKFRGRSYDRPTALALLAALMVGNNTDVLMHTGFLLSFGAVAGVILAEHFLSESKTSDDKEEKMNSKKQVLKWIKAKAEEIKELFVVSFCIQLVTIPILCSFFYEISLYAVFVNLFILPCMSVLFGCGILGGIGGCFSIVFGKIVLLPCQGILLLFETVCSAFLEFPNAVWITGTFNMAKFFLWYGALLILYICIKKKTEGNKWKYTRIIGILGSVAMLAGCLLFAVQEKGKIVFLDVGQGDGIYINTGAGSHLFIDGGSSSASKVGTYRILPFLKYHGIQKIDYWFISHCDMDHISGLVEVLESNYPVAYLVVSKFIQKDEMWMQIFHLAKEKNISILYMEQGQNLYSKDKNGNVTWIMKCLFPKEKPISEDKNAMSLTLLYENGDFQALFAGDLAAEQELKLIEENCLPKIEVLKGIHHGSKYSNSRELLEKIQPEITVISCGEGNRYGHPHTEAIERLKNIGSTVIYTMEGGQITLEKDVNKIKIENFTIP